MYSNSGAPEEFCRKKSYEVSYVLFRLAANSKSRGFSSELETQAAKFLSAVMSKEYSAAETLLSSVECFMRMGGDANILNPYHTQLVIKEVESLLPAIADLKNSPPAATEEIGNIFVAAKPKAAKFSVKPAMESANDDADAAMRQSAIVERIRQTGNCRFADIQEIFPNVSERTLRYHLQEMVESGKIERAGSGGRSSFYRLKSEPAENIELPVDGLGMGEYMVKL